MERFTYYIITVYDITRGKTVEYMHRGETAERAAEKVLWQLTHPLFTNAAPRQMSEFKLISAVFDHIEIED